MNNSRLTSSSISFVLAVSLSGFACNLPSNVAQDSATSGRYGKVKVIARAESRAESSAVSSAVSKDAQIQNAVATIHELQIRNTSGQFLTFTEQDYQLNLSELGNGVSAVLGRAQVPDGDYDQLRLITAGNGSVTLSDGSQHALIFPSGSESGIKVMMDSPVTIRNGQITALRMELDLSHSFVQQGNGDFLFKPVVRVEVSEADDPNPDGEDEDSCLSGDEDDTNGASCSSGGTTTSGGSATTGGGTTTSGGGTTTTSGGTTTTSGGTTTTSGGGTTTTSGGTTTTSGGTTTTSGGTTTTSGGTTTSTTVFPTIGV